MPILRNRAGSCTPSAGEDTSRPPMLMRPDVEYSRPATHRSVVVLPQPEGPSSTTISPVGTWKLTPSTAGRPVANCLRRSRTSSEVGMHAPSLSQFGGGRTGPRPSLAIVVGPVPVFDPGRTQLLILLEVRNPGLHLVRIVAFGEHWRDLERGQVSLLLDHEGLPFDRQAPVQEKLGGVGILCAGRDAGGIRIDRHALWSKNDLHRSAVALLGE